MTTVRLLRTYGSAYPRDKIVGRHAEDSDKEHQRRLERVSDRGQERDRGRHFLEEKAAPTTTQWMEASCSYRQPHQTTASANLPRDTTSSEDRVSLSRLYSALDIPSQAANLICRDVLGLRERGQVGGLRLFEHRKRPAVFAKIVGRIVGVEEKERKVTWLIDDGSAVVAVQHALFREKPASVPLGVDPMAHAAIGGQHETKCGIPEKYLRPLEPVLPPSTRDRPREENSERKRSEAIRQLMHLSVGRLVVVVGRIISLFFGQGEILLQADRAIPEGTTWRNRTIRATEESYICLESDADEEARHLLNAIQLSEGEYSRPFQQPTQILHNVPPAMLSSTRHSMTLRNADSTTSQSAKLLRTYGTTSSNKSNVLYGITHNRVDGLPQRKRRDGPTLSIEPRLGKPQEPLTKPSTRPLRNHRKLPDSSMKEDTLKVYVEKHIRDHCSVVLRPGKVDEPPAFSLSYLTTNAHLRPFGERVVAVALQERASRRRQRRNENDSGSHLSPKKDLLASKCEALFASIVRTLLTEGIIVLADRSNRPQVPFDGQDALTQSRTSTIDGKEARLQKSSAISASNGCFQTARTALLHDLENSAAFDPDTSRFWHQRAAVRALGGMQRSKVLEAYQLVTPALLVTPLRRLLEDNGGSACESLPIDSILSRLKAVDERWRYLTSDSVEAALDFI